MPDQSLHDQLAAIVSKNLDFIGGDPYVIAEDVIAASWRPPARVIETPENEGDYTAAIAALDALPRGAVIQLGHDVYQSIGSGWWATVGRDDPFSSEQVVDMADGDPVTVLHTPENGDTR